MGLLDEGEASVQELAERLGTTHQNASKHLGVLHQAGMVSRHRVGTSIRYALVDWTGWWLVEQIATSAADHLDQLRDALG
ncbi:MAG: hypothetical protein QOD71_454 [Thermoleophilaceae bacterium]|jgi:DNA-binding transcriptional ArsR family regulator|nr:hypothetical protein [Thermoleophilaceae bacterium]